MQAQPDSSKAGHEQFIVWFKAQNFYTNLAFAHGDRLFDFEQSENTFRVLAVQTAWCVWQEQQKRIGGLQKINDEVLKDIKNLSENLIRESRFYQDEIHISLFGRQLKRIHDDAKRKLKGGEV